MKLGGEVIEVNLEDLQALLERKREALGEEDYQKLKKGLWALRYLSDLISDQDTTIGQLRALLVKPSTEKTSKVLEQAGIAASPQNSTRPNASEPEEPKPGHGTERRGRVSRSPPHPDCARFPQAARPLSPVLERQGLRTEGAGLAHPGGGAGAPDGYGL